MLKSLPDKYVDSMNPALHMLFVLQKVCLPSPAQRSSTPFPY
jgi:hypothetical protein